MNLKKRILIKLSGEAFSDNKSFIDNNKLNYFVQEIISIHKLNIQICIVVGGGNILRGSTSNLNISRYKADNVGMLSTIINSIALQDCLEQNNISSVVLNSFNIDKIASMYTTEQSLQHLDNNKIVICSGGTSNPYFSTDMAAVIRALENNCSMLFKGTKVDGVYNADPKQHSNATKIPIASFNDVINNNLSVMDIPAILIAKQQKLPIVIFNIYSAGALKEIVEDVLINNKNNSNCSIIK